MQSSSSFQLRPRRADPCVGALLVALALLAAGTPPRAAAAAVDPASAIATIKAVGADGKGNAAATRAWQELSGAEPSQLPALLEAMDGAGPVARNWLFTAANTIADRALKAGGTLPVPALGEFLLETAHDGRSRRAAFELIARAQPETAEALLGGLLDDPAAELRREAVQRLVDRATKTLADGRKDAATVLFRQVLGFARDADQIEAIGKPLKELGQPVDLVRQLGFLTRWWVIGPFDNAGGGGFEKPYPPETGVKLDAVYDGKEGQVRWKDFTTAHEQGMVDLNKAYAPLKAVAGYAFAEFHSETARPAELRLGCKNGWKIWFNGRFVFGRDEYHRGAEIDQYRFPIELKAGANTILVKLTQDEQKEEWTVEWEFQLRITDPTGRVIRSAANPPRVASINP